MTTKSEVLQHVNNIRREAGLEELSQLTPGIMSQSDECVIARSLREGLSDIWVSVDSSSITTTNERFAAIIAAEFGSAQVACHGTYVVGTPDIFGDFIDIFDSNKYPELVAS